MASRFLGYLTEHRLALYSLRSTSWELLRDFSKDEVAELPGFLHRDKPLHLVADLAEMDFRQEPVPFLRGQDRRSIHSRKLEQAFRGYPLRHALSLGRSPDNPAEEKLLLSAITNSDAVLPWLHLLNACHLPISGIAGAPILQGRLMRPVSPNHLHFLLVTIRQNDSVRLTYFRRKEMCFSQVAHSPSTSDDLAPTAFEEVIRTHRHLLNQRLMQHSSVLHVLCIVPESEMESWRSSQPSAGPLKFLYLSYHEAARLAGLNLKQAGSSAEDLSIALLVKARFPNHFASPAARQGHFLHRLRRILIASSGALALGATVTAEGLLSKAWDQSQEIGETEAQVTALHATVGRLRDSLPQTDIPIQAMRQTLALIKNLEKENAPARRLLADLSRGFDMVGEAELEQLTWNLSGPPAPVLAERFSPRRWEAQITGAIIGASSYRHANSRLEALQKAIQGDTVAVDILEYPLNILSDVEMQEDFSQPLPERLPFRLRVTWKD